MNFFKVGISRSAILYVFLAVIIGGLIGIVEGLSILLNLEIVMPYI